jgi:tRNA 2-thiouridine synthesizing protein A
MNEILNLTETIKATTTIDVDGLVCPLPLLLTKKNLGRLSIGDILQVNGIQPSFSKDFKGWCERNGHFLIVEKESKNQTSFFIKKGGI